MSTWPLGAELDMPSNDSVYMSTLLLHDLSSMFDHSRGAAAGCERRFPVRGTTLRVVLAIRQARRFREPGLELEPREVDEER